MDAVSEAANWNIFAPPEDPMWPDKTKKLSTRLNERHYDRIMDGFSEEEQKLARKKFEGASKQLGPWVDPADYLAHRMSDLLEGLAQILLERELTTTEHCHVLEHGLPLDTWHHGFTKLARCTFTATDYITKEDILECRILMCRLACTNPGKMWDVRKSIMYTTVEATAWAGSVRAVGSLYAHSPPPAKGSLRVARSRTTFSPASQGFPKVPLLPWSSASSLCRLPLR